MYSITKGIVKNIPVFLVRVAVNPKIEAQNHFFFLIKKRHATEKNKNVDSVYVDVK